VSHLREGGSLGVEQRDRLRWLLLPTVYVASSTIGCPSLAQSFPVSPFVE